MNEQWLKDRKLPQRVAVFYWGNPRDFNSWSSVHYHMAQAFDRHCSKVVHVDMSPPKWVERAYNAFMRRLLCILRPFTGDILHGYMHTRLTRRRVERLMRATASDHPDLDLVIMTCLFFDAARYFTCPVVLYSDQATKQLIRNRHGRDPVWIERRVIEREAECMQKADLVVLMGEAAAKYIREHYPVEPGRVVRVLGGIKVAPPRMGIETLISRKMEAKTLLFIGRDAHKRGVDILLEAFQRFRKIYDPEYRLVLVGIRPHEVSGPMDNIERITFLDKSVPAQWQILETLMVEARLFVMPSRYGPGVAALVECMRYATPALMTPSASSCVHNGVNGWIETSLEPSVWAARMAEVISSIEYESVCRKAEESTRNITWDGFPARLVQALRSASATSEKRRVA